MYFKTWKGYGVAIVKRSLDISKIYETAKNYKFET